MGALRTAGIAKQPWLAHAILGVFWAWLLFMLGFIGQAGPLPWLAWALGLAPLAAGLAFFAAWRKEGSLRWIVLLSGEVLGIVLGSLLLDLPTSDPANPLVMLLLFPLAWAALELPSPADLALLLGADAVYLLAGIWRAFHSWSLGLSLVGVGLYLAAFTGVFFLLRLLVTRLPPEPAAEAKSEEPAVAVPPIPVVGIAPDKITEVGAGTAAVAAAAVAAHAEPAKAEPAQSSAGTPAPLPVPIPAPTTDDALHQDLRVARDIQVSLLLASSPRMPGWESSTSFLPARELGGDLYDFIELDRAHVGIMIGDVSGKGIPAALHMAVARTLFRMEARHTPEPASALIHVNRAMIEQIPQGCVTLAYAQLNIQDGSLRLSNAGHNYPIILNDSVSELLLNGLPLGIDADYTFEETTACLQPGDVLVFYTDGIIEAVNEAGELFGFERLRQLLEESTVHRPRTLTRQIVRAVRAFTGPTPQSDDITLVVLRRRFKEPVREMSEVALDVLGPEGRVAVREQLEAMKMPPDAPSEAWRAAILTLCNSVRDRWGQGLSRELMQQLFLTLEGL